MIILLSNILVFAAIGVFLWFIHRNANLSVLSESILLLFLLFAWNLCTLSVVANLLYFLSLSCLCVCAYKKRKIKTIIIWCVFCTSVITAVSIFTDMPSTSVPTSEKQKEEIVSFNSDAYMLSEGVRMGDGYKADYCALQACAIYKGELYQFFNKGYYEVRDTASMKLVREGKLNIPVDIHFGSVAFSNKVERGCTMPYLYATDDAGREGCVYVIDFEKQRIISNYNVAGGSIAAFDFEANIGYLVDTDNKGLVITTFDLRDGRKKEKLNIETDKSLNTLQTVICENGHLYLLSGEIGKSLMMTRIDLAKKVADVNCFRFEGEPEGMFVKNNGDIIVTANIGEWNPSSKNEDRIHSEYFILKRNR